METRKFAIKLWNHQCTEGGEITLFDITGEDLEFDLIDSVRRQLCEDGYWFDILPKEHETMCLFSYYYNPFGEWELELLQTMALPNPDAKTRA